MSQITSLISPISLPDPEPDTSEVTILGWGKTGDTGGGVSPDLKYVEVSST